MPDLSDISAALDSLETDGFDMNQAWKTAHNLAQANEGSPAYDALHAFCHRIENDPSNAAYWDRRAGTSFGGKGHVEELAKLRAYLEAL